MNAKPLWRGWLAVVTLSLCTTASAQEVPASWLRFSGSPFDLSCAYSTGTSWIITMENGAIVAHPEATADVGNVHDPLPYELDYTPAMLGPHPAPNAPLGIAAIPGRPLEDDTTQARRTLARARRQVLQVEDGWLIGFNAGEFGGSLWWFPSEPGPGVKLADGVVRFLVRQPRSGQVLTFLGLDYGDNVGQVLLVERSKERGWETTQIAELGAAPEALSVTPNGDLVLATGAGVWLIQEEPRVQALVTFAATVIPQSVLLAPSGDIFVGLPFFVLRVPAGMPSNGAEYYIPPGCARVRDGVVDCVCDQGVLASPVANLPR